MIFSRKRSYHSQYFLFPKSRSIHKPIPRKLSLRFLSAVAASTASSSQQQEQLKTPTGDHKSAAMSYPLPPLGDTTYHNAPLCTWPGPRLFNPIFPIPWPCHSDVVGSVSSSHTVLYGTRRKPKKMNTLATFSPSVLGCTLFCCSIHWQSFFSSVSWFERWGGFRFRWHFMI